MDEKGIRLEARLGAIEYMIAHLHKVLHGAIGATPEMTEDAIQQFEKSLENETFPALDPASSDLVAGEIQDAFRHLLGVIREVGGLARKSGD